MFARLRERLGRVTRPSAWSRNQDPPAGGPAADSGLSTLENASRTPQPADVGRLRRERRRLLRAREQSVRDLGGLALEMVRRDVFKPDLLKRRARDILGLEDSVYDLEDALDDARQTTPDPAIGSPTRCLCGVTNERGAAFCSTCGRSLERASAVVTCIHCTTPMPADARYCPSCGMATETAHESPTGAGW